MGMSAGLWDNSNLEVLDQKLWKTFQMWEVVMGSRIQTKTDLENVQNPPKICKNANKGCFDF